MLVHNRWKEIRPELNTESLLSIGRIIRVASHMTMVTDELVGQHGLNRGEFELLAAVRRSGKNCRATELSVMTKASGAAITKRLDRLSNEGLLTREVLPRDRRVVLVNLTHEGRTLIDDLIPEVLEAENKLLAGFDETEIAELQRLSAKLLDAAETSK